jgi:hypothetical protein
MSFVVSGLLALCEAFATAATGTQPQLASKNSRFLGPIEIGIERAGTTGGGTVYGVNLLGPSNANRQDFVGEGGAVTDYQTSIAYAALSNHNWVVKVDRSPRTGTCAVTAGSKTVTGTSTEFLTELKVGAEIVINGERRAVTAIASATSLTVDVAFVTTATGKTASLVDDILVPTVDFSVSDVGGYAKIVLAAAAKGAAGAKLEVHRVTPVALFTFATATTTTARREVQGYDLLWYVSGATSSPSATNIYARPLGQ